MEIEFCFLLCGFYVVGCLLFVEEVVVTFVNIVFIDREDENIIVFLGFFVMVVGCDIESIYRFNDVGNFEDV